jgi:hypothetical protein
MWSIAEAQWATSAEKSGNDGLHVRIVVQLPALCKSCRFCWRVGGNLGRYTAFPCFSIERNGDFLYPVVVWKNYLDPFGMMMDGG